MIATALASTAVVAPAASAPPGAITTVAGGGVGDGYPASRAYMASPQGLGLDGAGSVYVADNTLGTVRKIGPDGIITTVAGTTSVFGFAGDGGPATKALLQRPTSLLVDSAGRLFIGDSVTRRVRRVELDGVITTIAGNGTNVDGADGTLATAGGMVGPDALAFDPVGAVVIGESDRVRRVDTTGHITTIAGGGSPADGLGDGGQATAAALSGVQGLAYAADGTLYISDQNNQRIRAVSPTGVITTVAGDGNFNDSGDGGPAAEAEIAQPVGVTVDSTGNVYFAEATNVVRRISPSGIISTFAGTAGFFADDGGDGGPATAAHLATPWALTVDATGTVYVAQQASGTDSHARVRKVTTDGIISAVGGGHYGDGDPAAAARLRTSTGFSPEGGLRWQSGSYYISDPGDDRVRRVGPDGIMSTVAGGGHPEDGLGDGGLASDAALATPMGVAPTPDGGAFIADCGFGRVRRVDPSGHIFTVAGGGSPADGVGDGGPAIDAALDCPTGILVVPPGAPEPAGTIYVTDCSRFGDATDRVRRIDPAGTITTVAGTGVAGFNGDGLAATATQLSCPSDLVLDPAGNLVIADDGNNRVRRIDSATGVVSTIAGDGTNGYGSDGAAATSVPVNNPSGLAYDPMGRLVIAESTHARVRRVSTAGIISTVAGTGVPGFSGDGGPAPDATLWGPAQVALDDAGGILVDDTINVRVRRIEAGTAIPPAPGECGGVVSKSLSLKHDVGPCPAGSDGIVVGADNVSINLNGHSVIGPGAGRGDGTHAGIRLTQRSGVKVTGGLVTGFDAGVALIGSSNSTIAKMTVKNNVAPLVTPNGFDGAEFGDGIVLMYSAHNVIDANTVDGNGAFDGIGLLGLGTDHNAVTNNVVVKVVGDGRQGTSGIGIGIDISPFLDLTLPGRGSSLYGNDVIGNTVRNNYTNGISVQSNIGATIARNVVRDNGLANPFPGNGIGIVHNARAEGNLDDTVAHNTVRGNAGDGINLVGNHNRITDNTVVGNALVRPGAFEGREVDFDPTTFQPSCLANLWASNTWGPAGVSPPCVAGSVGASTGSATASTPADTVNNRHLTPADARVLAEVVDRGGVR